MSPCTRVPKIGFALNVLLATNLDGGPDVDESGAAEVRDAVHGQRHHQQLLGTVALPAPDHLVEEEEEVPAIDVFLSFFGISVICICP